MPELPEVETVVRSIRPFLVGKTIQHAEFYSPLVTRADRVKSAKSLSGRQISGIRRLGKQIFIHLDSGVLFVHLGMTGKLLWNGTPGNYTRAIIELDGGTLIYDDIRQFGRVEFFKSLPTGFARGGPDALDISFTSFYDRLKKHRGQVKALLLNQSFVSGVGNIYADELLFDARIHPQTLINRLSKERAARLHESMIKILELAIKHRGSSISDYVDGAGEQGSFQQLHNVYGRTGNPCPRCRATIRRILVGQRGTHYCPRCQRA